ncbi:MAG TPA: ABC transporter permease [Actinophytocola sp.]|uniref:ABC transporter permease n=1 Tax=Actinophytocola sp. TaxID=1872138 RepID=UPI002DDCEE06|nr:ABC transporter permease [Actinophytocola sp.]HEV2784579.1 ABC transporter permease [Actinophytocola sp.]
MRGGHRAELGVAAPRIRIGDLVRESALSVLRFPARSLLTALGTVLAAAAFVSTLGLISTLGQQVSSTFDVRRATEVVVRSEDPGLGRHWQGGAALDRLRGLNGVAAAGPRVILAERPVRRLVGFGQAGPGVRIMGADPDTVRAMAPNLLVGRLFGPFDEATAARLVLLPRGIADELGITRTQAAVFVDDQAYTVAGIYDDVLRRPEALQMVLMPFSTANRLAGAESAERDVLIETSPGAAQLIGHQAPLALHPAAPNALRSIAPPDPRALRREIEADVTRSSVLISVLTLIIGTVSIANAATAGVSARRSEIGLRRAVGGRPGLIFAQLVCETTVLGALGGLLGALLGLCVTSAVSLWNAWTPILDLHLAFAAAATCAATGLLAGLIPATRALHVQPVAALQR